MNKEYKLKREELLKKEDSLSKYASRTKDSYRINDEEKDIRPDYFRDIDRIIYSMAYSRYSSKTQVFSFNDNDHISKRNSHVQFVSKIARTIGRLLNLNEDLIEAIALAHDIGHPPIGHVGEKILDELSLKYLNENYEHNVQSVRYFMEISNHGRGSNLTVQVLDGIMSHNGEVLNHEYHPNYQKTKDEFLNEYKNSYKDKNISKNMHPMTLEAAVVRISDIIAYIGRDIEDAYRLKLITEKDIPEKIKKVLGKNNREIINTLVLDIYNESKDKSYIKLSEDVYNALEELKTFNYKNIYEKSNTKNSLDLYRLAYNTLFEEFLKDLEEKKLESPIYKDFLNDMTKEYVKRNNNKRIVIDFISGMTDNYFLRSYLQISRAPFNENGLFSI